VLEEHIVATWEQVRQNPTLYPQALLPGEGERFRWHRHADQPHSSQVFCLSAFGTLQHLPVRDQVVGRLLSQLVSTTGLDPKWHIELEVARPDLLSEYGQAQPSSVDFVVRSRQAVVCVEAKFLKDAEAGFGGCSQPKRSEEGGSKCEGYFGPGSDLKTGTGSWCRLEIWYGQRSPRTYWTMGRAFFQESVFAKQEKGQMCPFNGPHYQLMRNFLFAAAVAQQERLETFGVVSVAPAKKAGELEREVDSFRKTVLQPQFTSSVRFVTYEWLIGLLRDTGDAGAVALGTFLSEKISALIP
jgi:hypothetical protein